VNLEDCLPANLRPASITRIGLGQSGAGVYRVISGGTTAVLKVAAEAQPLEAFRTKVDIQRAAAAAGVAPRILHVDETRRAVVSEHVSDRGYPMLLANPASRANAIAQLGATLRRLHAIALPASVASSPANSNVPPTPPAPAAPTALAPTAAAPRSSSPRMRTAPVPLAAASPVALSPTAPSLASSPRDALEFLRVSLERFPLAAFARDVIDRVLAETPPPSDRALVLSHNDVNPTNLAYDGDRLILLDWDVAGANDPFYDLAAVAVFFLFDEATCSALIAAHDAAAPAALPPRFLYMRRLVATVCGAMMVHLARQAGHPGAPDTTLESTSSLPDFYARLRAGAIDISSSEGRWQFGLALLKTATSL